MKKLILPIIFVGLWCSAASAGDTYFGPVSTGSNNGTSCANAYAYNDGTNGINTAGKQVAGNNLHVCPGSGWPTAGANAAAYITISNSGSSGSPITVVFDQGAVTLAAKYWGANGAINITGNFVTLDGGNNLTVENTLAGTAGGACLGGACNVQPNTAGIQAPGGNIIIKNLTVTHIYVHTEGVNDGGGDNNNCIETGVSHELVTHTNTDSCYTGIGSNGSTNGSSIEFSFNTLKWCNHCLKIPINSGTITGVKMHDNDISDTYIWDEPDDGYHHNGIFCFADPAGTITGDYYNNYFHGTFSRDASGDNTTAYIFLEYDNANSRIFNNVFAPSAADLGPDNGDVTIGGSSGPQSVYNNTFVCVGGCNEFVRGGNNNLILSNNIMSGPAIAVDWTGTGTVSGDKNIYYNLYNSGTWNNNSGEVNFSSWKSGCGCDANSTYGSNPNLSATYQLQSGSPAIGLGVNLTSLGITALDTDKAGVPRPNSGAWDDGAYTSGSTATAPNPPTGLVAAVN